MQCLEGQVERLACNLMRRLIRDTSVQQLLRLFVLLQSLEQEIASFGKEQGKHIAAAKTKLKAAKADVEAAKKVLKTKQAALAEAVAQQEAASSERAALSEQLQTAVAAVNGESASSSPSAMKHGPTPTILFDLLKQKRFTG